MDLWTLIRIIGRRWLVVVPTLLLTCVAAFAFVINIAPKYSGFESIVLVPENQRVAEAGGAQMGPDLGSMMLAASALAEIVQGGEAQDRIVDAGGVGAYEVIVDGANPLLRVRARGESQNVAVTTAKAVLEGVQTELAARQEARDPSIPLGIEASILANPVRASSADEEEGGGYVAEGSVLLVTPAEDAENAKNPFLLLQQSTMTAIAELSNTDAFIAHLEQVGGTAAFEISPDIQGPILRVTANGDDRETVAATLDGVFQGLNSALAARQEAAGAPEETLLHLELLSPPEVDAVPGDKMRPLVALLGLGTGAAFALAVLVESIVTRRRRANESEPALDWDWGAVDAQLREDGSQADPADHAPSQR